MYIAVNTRLLLKGKLEGIGFFTKETLARITRSHPEHQFIFIFDRPYDDEFIFSDNILPVVVSPPTRHPLLWFIWFEWRIPAILKKYKADLFFSPDGYLSLRTGVPQVAAIHDLNFVHRPKDLPWLKAKYYNFFFPRFARRARRIVTVSNYSKDDIVRSYKINPAKIDVAYNGVNSLYKPVAEEEKTDVRQKYTDGCNYFLFIGSLHPRKNIDGLLRAYDAFRKSVKTDIKLVIAGGQMFKTGDIEKTFRRMRHKSDVIFTGRISSEEMRLVLGTALCLTFVPFFEGFGIPVIEAMSAGVPVISSNTTSLPEVGGDAVLYVDPSKPEEIKNAMIKIARDDELRKEMIGKGLRQKEKYSWDNTATIVWSAMEQCMKNETTNFR